MMSRLFLTAAFLLGLTILPLAPSLSAAPTPGGHGTRLGIEGTRFTINGKPTFLLGMSYFAAAGAPEGFVRQDFEDLRRLGFNWVRVWATWSAYESDISSVDGDGNPRQPYLSRLQETVAEANRRGLVVDITLSRGTPSSAPHLGTPETLERAVRTVVTALKPYPNWYIDLANERNIGDSRHVSFAELAHLRQVVRQMDPDRLVTASHGGDIDRDDLKEYLFTVGVDLVCPHRPRDPGSPAMTRDQTRQYLAWMKELGKSVPVHYQEPFRRGYGKWQPQEADYLTDARGAVEGGAAGWCLHNGGQQGSPGEKPRRSFDMSDARLFDQLDPVELAAARALSAAMSDGRYEMCDVR